MDELKKMLDFLNYVETSFIEAGFTKVDENKFTLGHYTAFIIEVVDNIDRIGIKLENQKYIQDDTIDIPIYDIRSSSTYFNFKNDTEKEIYRRFNAGVMNGSIKQIPSYKFLLRNKKINNINER